jgi:hypothetical protein
VKEWEGEGEGEEDVECRESNKKMRGWKERE